METTPAPTDYAAELILVPPSENYLNLPIGEASDWHGLISRIKQYRDIPNKLYLVDFQSTRNPEADAARIEFLDAAAFAEAAISKALLAYQSGTVSKKGKARSSCLWIAQEPAHLALLGPAHKQAVHESRGDPSSGLPPFYLQHSVDMYDVYHLSHRTIFRPVYREKKRPS